MSAEDAEPTIEDIASSHVLNGVPDERVVQILRADNGLKLGEARKVLKSVHAAIAKQHARPIEWHRANACRLWAIAVDERNLRVALEAMKELARLDGVHDIGRSLGLQLDGSPESVTPMLVAVINGVVSGAISNNTLQALMPALRELRGHLGEVDDSEDLGRIDVAQETIAKATDRIMQLYAAAS